MEKKDLCEVTSPIQPLLVLASKAAMLDFLKKYCFHFMLAKKTLKRLWGWQVIEPCPMQ
jgi:hypothetical protein